MARKTAKKPSRNVRKRAPKKIAEIIEEPNVDEVDPLEEELDEIERLGVEGAEELDEEADDVMTFSEAEAAFDIFVDFGAKIMEKGGIPRYTILRNNQHLATVDHPYSWDEIQKEYGGGHYKVICRNGATGQFVKSQTRMVAEIPGQRPLKGRHVLTDEEREELLPPQQHQPSVMEMMGFLKQMNADSRREAEMQNSGNNNALASVLTVMMQSQQTQAQQMQNMIMELNKFQTQMIQEMSKSQMAMFEKMNSKIDNTVSKKTEFDPFKMIEMLSKEREAGIRQAKELRELAQEIAEESMDRMGDGDEKGGWASALMKSLPMLVNGMAQQGQPVPQPRVPTPMGNQIPVSDGFDIYGRRRPVAQPQPQPRPLQRPPSANPQARPPQARPVPSGAQPIQGREPRRPVPVEVVDSNKDTGQRKIAGVPLKDAVQQVALPLLTQRMPENADPKATARELLSKLAQISVTRQELVANFTWPEIMAIVEQYSLQSYEPWLREFYNEVQGPRSAPRSNGVGPRAEVVEPVRAGGVVREHPKDQPNATT